MDRLDIEDLQVSTEQPTLEFESGSFTLTDILESYLLPMVVQLDAEKHTLPFSEFNFDLSQPLLLYKKRNIQKVPAISVTISGDQYVDVGESLLIPEDYKGWFAVLQRWTGNEKADENVPHFKTVEELANSNTDKFLIGGTKRINGLHVFERSESQLSHQQSHFTPGDILIRDKLYFGETKKRSRLFRKPKYITEKFLMCRDDADREILLPFEQKGIFYQVSERCGKPNHNVMQMSDIVARNIPPRIIKLVFGRFPVTPCSFTGLMKADTARLESSIIASTIINTKNILIEIPLTANIHFKLAKLTQELKSNQCYKNALNLCMERATTYMRNIKVCYNFPCKEDENIQLIKKEADMDLISSDEGNDDSMSQNDIKEQSKKSSSLKRRFRKTKSLERNNNTVEQHEKKSSIKRGGSKKAQLKQCPNGEISQNGIIDSVDLKQAHGLNTRFSHEVESENMSYIRSARSFSTGRMSFCFGNSYLTMPVFATDLSTLNEDNKRSRDHLDEMVNGLHDEDVEDPFPPSMPCTSIGSYVNTGDGSSNELNVENLQNRRPSDVIYNVNFGEFANTPTEDHIQNNDADKQPLNLSPQTTDSCAVTVCNKTEGEELSKATNQLHTESDNDDYIPVSNKRRPSSKPPDFAPPLVPSHGSFNNCRESINSTSDASEQETTDHRLSSTSVEHFQYDTPKLNESPSLTEIHQYTACGEEVKLQKARRPSTFTFTEGLHTLPNNDPASMPLIDELGAVNEDSPIYENIQALQELMITMENLEINETREVMGDFDVRETETISIEGEKHDDEGIQNDVDTAEAQPIEENIETNTCNRFLSENLVSQDIERKLTKSVSVESSSSKVSKQNSFTERQKSIQELTEDEIINQLEQIGIKDNSLNRIKELKIDGKVLSNVAHDDESLKECLPDVSLIDLQKISMFLRGWRPHEESEY